MTSAYPSSSPERTRWILEKRGTKNEVSSKRAYAAVLEKERNSAGEIEQTATVFLTNKECPWKCVMCDLWRNTTQTPASPEDIVSQIRDSLPQFPEARALKLYNSGSFFDAGAIPPRAWREIASLCRGFRRLVVECHPRLIDRRVLDFRAILPCSMEIALGLETAHTESLERLNKRATVDDYRRAAAFLQKNKIDIRTFLLVHPPFVRAAEQETWIARSLEVAFEAGSAVVSLIPLRAGNGAIEQLIESGDAAIPTLDQLEAAHSLGLENKKARTFADTWDLHLLSRCERCFSARRARLERMNLAQVWEKTVACSGCGNG